ncbi:MAG: GMP synthase [Proteobacteria bacterium]|nr:GMP synthase [Pseudomonadota bacterium]
MRCHFIQHAHFETPGSLLSWAKKNNLEPEIYHPYKGEKLPEVNVNEPVIFLGGPQSAREFQKYDYLEQEVAYIKSLISQGQPLIGICLGAQLIGESLGAKTELSPEKEIGIFPIRLTKNGETHPYFESFPDILAVMHWHNDMPGLTKDASILAFSEGCPRQIISYAPRVLGLQCHLEATPEWLNLLLTHASGDLKPSRFTQTAETMLKTQFQTMNHHLHAMLDKWLAL